MAMAISLYDAPTAMETEKYIVLNAMAQAMMNVPGVMVQVRNNAHLAVVEAGRNAGLVLDREKSDVQVVTEPAMICGTTNVHGAGGPGIKNVHHVLERDMTNVYLAMVPDIKNVHGVGDAVIRIATTAMAQEQLNVNVAPDMANSAPNVLNAMEKVRYIM